MTKLFLKTLAFLVGLGILGYLLGRRFSIWEIEAVQQLKEKEHAPRSNSANNSDSLSSEGAEDLKQIKGIGKVIEQKLNQIGYFRLQQIASLTEEEKERIEQELSFPGRIERDQWVEQARSLLG